MNRFLGPDARADVLTKQPAFVPYGVVLLSCVFNGAEDQHELLLPLTLAYLVSAHLPFCFPMPPSAVTGIERVFDGILDGLPKESKGILYLTQASEAEITALVQRATLVIADEAGLPQHSASDVPCAMVCRAAGENIRSLKLRSAEKLSDEALKTKLIGCAQLINVQSAGLITEGHFSWSW